MSGTKETVHTEYLKGLESKQSLPELSWNKRTVLVIGSNSKDNIGASVSGLVAQCGASVIECDKHTSKLTKLGQIVSQTTDLVICCASVHLDWIENTPYSEIEEVVYNTLTSPMVYTTLFANWHVETEHRKHIVFVGSMAHRQVLNASAPYCASKAGLAHFARCMAWELTPKGFTIGTVHPGNVVGTQMTMDTIEGIMEYRNMTYDEAEAYWESTKLTAGWLKPEDVAGAVLQLLESSPHHSGAQIELAGGLR